MLESAAAIKRRAALAKTPGNVFVVRVRERPRSRVAVTNDN
jgi:hypothetical protein